ncbi:helix-turn-helix domain-containing protein [Candidatus Methanoperedens nitratireducens]|uniref:HTH arsR-type domain-containing protein n=1 Tax=Candidatus Methanoperedens nitratireducens TaxID=1392998 RepID=A0A284VQC6_9EURY|nr:ArsR family transcriptional regulator [Candidatus Methanoperedens nitroreducens]SNQ61418.1 hypothetical protein MNV_340008 [Candidatus Methanoperedens nitroreducens]
MRWLFKKNILENESRAAIFMYIKKIQKHIPKKIIHETNISRGTVLYHLDILLCAGMVACMKDSKLRNTAQRRRRL